jgi:hypothetical protein
MYSNLLFWEFTMFFVTKMRYADDEEAEELYLMMLRDGGVPTA